MRAHLPILIVLLLAAGAAVAPAPGGSVVGAMRLLEGPAYEPTLAITSAGNVFYSGGSPQNDAALPGEAWVHGSYDNGATWINTTSAIAADDIEVYDPFLTVDRATGRIFRLMMQALSVGGNGCMQLITSDDEGASWTQDPDLCVSPPFHDHESLAAGRPRGGLAPEGYPNLVHLCLNHAHGTDCAVSLDGAKSFLPPHPVFASVDPTADAPDVYCGGLNAPVQTDSAGRVFVTRFHCGVPKIAVSDDGGLTWTTHALPGPAQPREKLLALGVDIEPDYIDLNVLSLAVDAADGLHVLYSAHGTPVYLYSLDSGATWSAPRVVAAPGITAADRDRIAIAAAAPGHVAFAYLATDHPGGYATSDWEGAEWDMMLGVLTDAYGGGDISWTQLNPADDPLGVDDCGVNRCTSDEPDELEAGMYDYIDVEIAPDGRPWVAMVDVCHAECRLTGVNDVAQGAVGTLASGPSLTRPGEALAALAWG